MLVHPSERLDVVVILPAVVLMMREMIENVSLALPFFPI